MKVGKIYIIQPQKQQGIVLDSAVNLAATLSKRKI
jgi:hypothetical protein